MQLQFHHILQQSHHQAHPRSYTDNFNTFCFFPSGKPNQIGNNVYLYSYTCTKCPGIHSFKRLLNFQSKNYLTIKTPFRACTKAVNEREQNIYPIHKSHKKNDTRSGIFRFSKSICIKHNRSICFQFSKILQWKDFSIGKPGDDSCGLDQL